MSVSLIVFFVRQLNTMFTCLPRDWFFKGNVIIIVSVLIILPLALMRHLGKRLPALIFGLEKGSQIERIPIFMGCGRPRESFVHVVSQKNRHLLLRGGQSR